MKKSKFIIILFLFLPFFMDAQCAMCRAVLENEDGGGKAQAINDGIVYLMAFPYLLVGIIAFLIWKMFRKKKRNQEAY